MPEASMIKKRKVEIGIAIRTEKRIALKKLLKYGIVLSALICSVPFCVILVILFAVSEVMNSVRYIDRLKDEDDILETMRCESGQQ